MPAELLCRSCRAPLDTLFADLRMSPISNNLRPASAASAPVTLYPLQAWVCSACKLVQLQGLQQPDELFTDDYVYFSSYSDSWLKHAERYAMAMTERFGLGANSRVVEVASNDGYLLQYFKARGIGVLGVEPARSVADVAERERGIPSVRAFFSRNTAARMLADSGQADLMAANNVLAHVPDINDFVAGFRALLADNGVATFEFPHLLNLIADVQFDTIYHEHYSYLSFLAVESVLARNGLRAFDVEELPTHGGSLRVYAAHGASAHADSPRVAAMRAKESHAGLDRMAVYRDFGRKMADRKCEILRFLIDCREQGKTVAGYGAPAKATTLLNYCGIGPELLAYTVDRSPSKQGRIIPGVGVPVHAPERILAQRPDILLIFPWNLREEIQAQMSGIREWGGHFAVLSPKVEVFA